MVFASKKDDGGNDVGKVRDKFSIKVCKPKKRADAFDRMLQFFFLIIPSCYSFILNVYLLGEVDAFTPILHIFSFVPHLLFVSLIFPWT